jgi:hypothetical protein
LASGRWPFTLNWPPLELIRRRQHHSRRQINEGTKAAPVQGQVFHELIADHCTHRCIGGVEQRRGPPHRNAFAIAADGERKIQSRSLVHFHHDAILVDGLEAVGFYCDVVRAGQKGWDAILALLVRGDGASCIGVYALDDHSCAGYREAGGIGDQSG